MNQQIAPLPHWVSWIVLNMRGGWLLMIMLDIASPFLACLMFEMGRSENDPVAYVFCIILLLLFVIGVVLTVLFLAADKRLHYEWRYLWREIMGTPLFKGPSKDQMSTMWDKLRHQTGMDMSLARRLHDAAVCFGFILPAYRGRSIVDGLNS